MEGNPVNFEDSREYFENLDRRIDKTYKGKYLISTVFIGVNRNFWGGLPLIFETMVFSVGELDSHYIERYPTKEEAIDGHKRIVEDLESYITEIEDGND